MGLLLLDPYDYLRRSATLPGGHAGMEEADEGLEACLVGADAEAAEWRGEERAERGIAMGDPLGVGIALGGGRAVEVHEASGYRIVGGEHALEGQFAVPRVLDAEGHRLVAAGEHAPAIRL